MQVLQTKLGEMESELDRLRTEAETSEEVPTIDTSDMENDISEAEEAVEEAEKRKSVIQEEIDALGPATDELKSKLEEISARNDKIADDLEAAEAKMEEYVKVNSLSMKLLSGFFCYTCTLSLTLFSCSCIGQGKTRGEGARPAKQS